MATLRPCETGFDDKVKAVITTRLMAKHQRTARFTHKHFKAISWVFMIAFVLSLGYSVYTAYNLVVFGTCDPTNPSNCVFNPGNPNQVVCPYQGLNPSASVATIGGFMDIQAANVTGKPTAYFFGTTWCPHCAWERPIFLNVTAKFAGYIDVKNTEIDVEQPPTEMAIFNHYSPGGSIPVVIISGKYYRVGSGEAIGQDAETNMLTALLCKVTGSPIYECNTPDVQALVQSI
jgi:thiol-disulfide isomerase/thioredoxin